MRDSTTRPYGSPAIRHQHGSTEHATNVHADASDHTRKPGQFSPITAADADVATPHVAWAKRVTVQPGLT